ncbi:uncharacterized protein F5891DRAFT_1201450 [Suillus fuscotomentosus]|uniref:Uncharacterized protein n=1 Tax=Suillus fuscotomentosus TaxID=1912939 RepID=A0AAD4HAZ3_9AGAM|nr:uncharacterized protein F5891DRAFT_1201450 [Suillus fuscotomentosus]KAG1885915.1 hypothetical protein F5891DRAFT_1201450 [Suillus fuscotomentosus]
MSFLGHLPVSVVFNLESCRCLVSASIARSLGHSGVGSVFSEVLTASYEGCSLTTNAEFVVTRALDSDVVVGMNWIAAWRHVGLEDVISDPESSSCTYLQESQCMVATRADYIAPVDMVSDSCQSSSFTGAVSSSRRRSELIICDIFLGSYHAGIRISPFSVEVTLLSDACTLHDLDLTNFHMLAELRDLLLRHFLNGECVVLAARLRHGDYTACCEIAAGFGGPSDMVDCILGALTETHASAISGDHLWIVAQSICSDLDHVRVPLEHCRRKAICILNSFHNRLVYEAVSKSSLSLFAEVEHISKSSLEAIASWHGLCYVGTKDQLLDRIFDHTSKGTCVLNAQDHQLACSHIVDECSVDSGGQCDVSTGVATDGNGDSSSQMTDVQINLSSSLRKTIVRKPLLCLLCCHEVDHDDSDSLSQLRKCLKSYIGVLQKGKRAQAFRVRKQNQYVAMETEKTRCTSEWPHMVSEERKKCVIEIFHEQTCSEALATFVCFACAAEYNCKERQELSFDDFDVTLLNRPDVRLHKGRVVDEGYINKASVDSTIGAEFLDNVMYEH